MRLLLNFAAFQAAWFACVLAGAQGRPWLGVAAAALVAALHLSHSGRPGREALLLAAAGLLGAVWDGLLVGFGWLLYPSGIFAPWIAPSWIIAMWVAFATTLNASLGWLRGRWSLATPLGAVGGPLAYAARAALGAVRFPAPWCIGRRRCRLVLPDAGPAGAGGPARRT